jgi:hypothetical protein
MLGSVIKMILPRQAKLLNIYKNTKHKLLKANAAIWFNTICRTRQLKSHYINIRISGHNRRSQLTTTAVHRFRITQELKVLYCKKQRLNQLLYTSHLQYSAYYGGMWQYIGLSINNHLHSMMDITYYSSNKTLDTLPIKQLKQNTNTPSTPSHTYHNREINVWCTLYHGTNAYHERWP